MTGIHSKMLLGAVAAAAIMAATPSSAFVAWACTAKDSSGHKYSVERWGFLSIDTRPGAASFTLDKCEKNSSHPGSCKIVSCKKTHA